MMDKIPYACGRLAEAARDIVWQAEQLPPLRETGSQQALRQIAGLIQEIVQNLREAVLLLAELEAKGAAEYTARLCRAVCAFHIRTPDYGKLVSAITGWAACLRPLLPDAEKRTVNAAVAGRMMNAVRLGYYPTDPAHVAMLKNGLAFPGKTVNLLDPCCGEGKALRRLADGQDAVSYGAELDGSRAEAAESLLDHVAGGSYFFARISRSAFHLLLLNPPYLRLHGGARSEKRFLFSSYDHLMMGGVLIYIVPYYRLTADICRFLAAHFEGVMAYRFCGAEFARFRQIAVLGRRKPYADNPRLAALLEAASFAPDKLPTLDRLPPGCYALPDTEKGVLLFQGDRFNVRELAGQMEQLGSILPKQTAPDLQEKRPPLPLSIGQIGLVGGSGLMNGLIECDAPHVLKGRIVREKRMRTGQVTENPDGSTVTETVETTVNRMVFNVLTPDGLKLLA